MTLPPSTIFDPSLSGMIDLQQYAACFDEHTGFQTYFERLRKHQNGFASSRVGNMFYSTLQKIHANNKIICASPRNTGKTRGACVYLGWLLTHISDKNAIYVVNSSFSASEFFGMFVHHITEQMESEIYNVKSTNRIEFSNRSSLSCVSGPMLANYLRGKSYPSVIWLDNAAHYEFINSINYLPDTTKIVVISTSVGVVNDFQYMWHYAQKTDNDWVCSKE